MKPTSVTEYLDALDDPLRQVGHRAREIIEAALPDATGVLYHGHPVWGLGDNPGQRPVCLLKAYRSDVTFGLWRGQDVNDPDGRLKPGARRMASVKLTGLTDIDAPRITTWLHQALALEQPQ
ncbi:DUF1801 domain-containing protein [Natronosporangium hydrolyticum]|uniref:DUF1801 domain-containing protein n=1 Tax=Natronosporangium hydrolyticum TaxID=2811111 RepID=A0A895YA64_9ACTN|nr:DUF1801 domain-containing protein [Natronosporangium hydrolyticum]QSB14251.1 DUF1801 domain-containing protein [Natronosporangium hydrolyticum]